MNRRHFLGSAAGPFVAKLAPSHLIGAPSKRRIEVLGSAMALVDTGSERRGPGRPTFVFVHGNPTSSYLWRKIIPSVRSLGRCVAPDLIGMGDSAKLDRGGPARYRFAEHRRFLDGLLDAAALGDQVILVLHDWGGMLGFDWAERHPSRVVGIAHMETVMDGLNSATAPPAAIDFFQRYRTPAGEAAVLRDNQFVERVLIGSLGSRLTDRDRAEYRRPFRRPGEGRRPTLSFPQQIPIDGDPTDVAVVFARAREWLANTPVPKLFVNAEPGALIAAPTRKAICRSWPNTREVVVASQHFVPEEAPEAVAQALMLWAPTLLG